MIRTVLGDITAEDLGFCHAHDHVLIGPGIGTARNPDLLIDDEDAAALEVELFRGQGGGALVDAMPLDCGRDPEGLVRVSKRTSVHIVAVTGLHTRHYYPPGHWSETIAPGDLAALMAAEITDGMDRLSHGGGQEPVPDRLPARAGLIKVATDRDGITPLARKIFEAAATCHQQTGAPVLTHTEHGLFAMEQISLLRELEIPPEAILVSHVDRVTDHGYHAELAGTGAYLVYDGPSRTRYHTPAEVATCIEVAVSNGARDRVLIGMDLALRSYRISTGGGPGLAWVLGTFLPLLRSAGFTSDDIERFGWRNPAAALTLRTPGSTG